MIRFVAPVQRDEVAWQFFDEFRVMQNDVAPEHHALAARGNFTVNLFQEVEINPTFAKSRAKLFALAAAQIPRLVAADVEELAGKVRQQLVVKVAQKRQRT